VDEVFGGYDKWCVSGSSIKTKGDSLCQEPPLLFNGSLILGERGRGLITLTHNHDNALPFLYGGASCGTGFLQSDSCVI
jgi:hypothetical protein